MSSDVQWIFGLTLLKLSVHFWTRYSRYMMNRHDMILDFRHYMILDLIAFYSIKKSVCVIKENKQKYELILKGSIICIPECLFHLLLCEIFISNSTLSHLQRLSGCRRASSSTRRCLWRRRAAPGVTRWRRPSAAATASPRYRWVVELTTCILTSSTKVSTIWQIWVYWIA